MQITPFSNLDREKYPKVEPRKTQFDLTEVKNQYPEFEFCWIPYNEDSQDDALLAYSLMQNGFSVATFTQFPKAFNKELMPTFMGKGKESPKDELDKIKFFGHLLFKKPKNECEQFRKERIERLDARLQQAGDPMQSRGVPTYTY